MKKRVLGRSGIEVSALGLGGWAIGGPFRRTADGIHFEPMGWGQVDDTESIRAIHRALDLGVTLFDTANNYGAGHSERVLGQALKGYREKVMIATKFASVFDEAAKLHLDTGDMPMTLDAIRQACEDSLRRLQTDYIDLYQFHWGGYPAEEAAEVRDILEVLVDEGKIRWYGWSTDDPARARVFAQGPHCTAIQHRLNVIYDAPEMLAVCDEFNLGSLNKSPLSSGFLTGKFTATTTFPEDDGRHEFDLTGGRGTDRLQKSEALRPLLTQDGRSMTQAALAWIWSRSDRAIPIPGFKTVRQVEENVGAVDWPLLSPTQMRDIDHLMGRES